MNKNGNFHSYNLFSLKYLKVIFDKKKNMENESLVSTNYGTNTKCGKVKLTKIQKFLQTSKSRLPVYRYFNHINHEQPNIFLFNLTQFVTELLCRVSLVNKLHNKNLE